jgi:hypothetical protein
MRIFATTIFLGAFLLFSLQPMMGKFLLPWFGGGTAVWSACLLFFQVVLLAGYAYAHCSARWLRPRTQAIAHATFVFLALLCLPVIPDARWQPNGDTNPTLSILLLLTATVGLPYLVLSTTGPLMQYWFSLIRPNTSPYPLYALSNAGSLVALVSYPFLLEPLFTRKSQALIWSYGMAGYALLIGVCALILWRARPVPTMPEPASNTETASSSWMTKALWLLLPACASTLLLATTNKICLDVTVMPFLWVLPLAAYLLSFVWSFAGRYRRRLQGATLAIPLLMVAYILYNPPGELPLQIPILVFALYYCCLVCHGELYRLKPGSRDLTSYYLMIATGGALGSALVTVIAPLIFDDYFELHWGFAMVPVLMTVIHWREGGALVVQGKSMSLWRLSAVASILFGIMLYGQVKSVGRNRVAAFRNFYGVLKVFDVPPNAPREAVALYCGTTFHGLQLVRPGFEEVPTGYYHERTGVGLLMSLFSRERGRRIGVVGLGTGTLAAYGRTNDVMRFYEINPMDIKVATERFSFLSRSQALTETILGDARLSLERESPQQYDVLVLDAFSSDAVPVHLLTREAFRVYERHLKPDGVIAAHVSSKHLNLIPVLEAAAAEFNLEFALLEWSPLRELRRGHTQIQPWQGFDSQWILLSRNKELMNRAEIRNNTTPLRAGRQQIHAWTDDHTSLLPLLVW